MGSEPFLSIIPAGFKFIALPLIWKYPLTEEPQMRILARLERRGVSWTPALVWMT